MATKKQIKELTESLLRAKEHANKYADDEDDGTCNFDTPQLFLEGWNPEEAKQAFEKADLGYDFQSVKKNLLVHIYSCLSGQGSRRTKMAEAMRDSLISDGYKAYVYYQMD